MVVEYTDLAKSSIRDIALYITENFSQAIAKKATDAIIDKADSLAFLPERGKALEGKLSGLRSLYYKQNQIIYQILEDRIQIIIVWDGRQDPDRLLDLILEFFSKRYKEI